MSTTVFSGIVEGFDCFLKIQLWSHFGKNNTVKMHFSPKVIICKIFWHIYFVGSDCYGWGLSYKGFLWHNGQKVRFCAPFYAENTVIGFHLNLYEGQLTIYKDGVCLGVAAEGLHLLNEQVFPAASSTSIETEVELGCTTFKHLSLQEKCFLNIARSVKRKADVDVLPLPHLMKRYLLSMT